MQPTFNDFKEKNPHIPTTNNKPLLPYLPI